MTMSALLAGIVMTDPVKPKQWASTALSDTSNAAKNEKRPSDGAFSFAGYRSDRGFTRSDMGGGSSSLRQGHRLLVLWQAAPHLLVYGIGMALPGSTPLTPILDFSGTSYRWDVMSFIQ
jgi:hypothetical protein